MKLLTMIVGILFWGLNVFSQSINSAEYFIDNDPGIGNATSLSVVNINDTATANFSASTTGLQSGFHTLCIRYRYDTGIWGLYQSVPFFLLSATALNALQINKAEYFIDSDPGIGNASAINFTATDTSNLILAVPTTALSAGFHTLNIRYRNTGNIWGLYGSTPFYILPAANLTTLQLNKAEYFFDTDPGIGNATALNFAATDTSNLIVAIPSNGLSVGFHTLNIRYRNTGNTWGLYESTPFYILPAANVSYYQINKAEYFIDTDPGFGNGTVIDFSPSVDTANVILNLVTTGLSSGIHTLNIRYRNTNGLWGLFFTDTFNLCSTPPVSIITSQGSPALCTGGSVLLKADTSNGAGTTYQWRFNNNAINGATNNTFLANAAGSYTCIVNKNCANTSNAIVVTINNNVFMPVVSITANPLSSCAGSSYIFTATVQNGGVTPTYQWKKNNINVGTNSPIYTTIPTYGTTIRCVIISNAQCATQALDTSNTITTLFNFLGNDQIKYILPNTTRNLTNIVNFAGASYSYRRSNWSTVFFPTAVPAGIYYIIGTVSPTCKDTVKITVKIGNSPPNFKTDLPDETVGDNISIYPNPTNQFLTVRIISAQSKLSDVKIFDLSGRLLQEKTVRILEGENVIDFSLKDYAQGLYILRYFEDGVLIKSEKISKTE
jgi:hypothetical protein